MIYIDCEQGSDEWFEARRGIPTASGFASIITPKTGKLSASADVYIAELIAETVVEEQDFQGNQWTERGHLLEPEARNWYEFETGNTVTETGIILRDDGSAGVSPDGLIGTDGLLEIKCPKPSTHVYWFLAGELPDKHRPQCHAALLLAERDWLDFVSYCPGFPALLLRVVPDDYTDKVAAALATFNEKLSAARARIFGERE